MTQKPTPYRVLMVDPYGWLAPDVSSKLSKWQLAEELNFDVSGFDIALASDVAAALQLAKNRTAEPFAIAIIAVASKTIALDLESARRLLAADPFIQVVLYDRDDSCSLEGTLLALGAEDRLTIVAYSTSAAAIAFQIFALGAKWRKNWMSTSKRIRETEQVTDTRRVMALVESCLHELEYAHCELSGKAGIACVN